MTDPSDILLTDQRRHDDGAVPFQAARQGSRILIAEPDGFSEQAREILSQAGTVEMHTCRREDLGAAFSHYDALWIRLAHRIPAELMPMRPRCRVLACPVTGLDHIDLDACRRRGIRVVSLRGETEFLKSVRATAELTVALTLALLRHVPAAAESVRTGIWNRDLFRGHELFERTAGIVGLGRLGTIVAGYFRALGMTVLGHDPRPDFPHTAARRVAVLDELLQRSDVVSLHVSYDESTRHLIGAGQFARMRPGAVLVNTSRGGVLDERALLAALEQGRLAGAALDVLDGEPDINARHPLVAYAREHSNLLIVPHIGGNSFQSFEKTEQFVARRVVEALADDQRKRAA
jgi:D-3-phosphoglycerate dehydrogenase